MVRPVPPVSTQTTTVRLAPETRRARLLREGRALVIRAEAVSATYAPERGQPSKQELDSSIDRVKADLDSMSEMGEMESLRLQMAMDRMQKAMQALSNILKKISDTSAAIIGNVK
jgi:hypothetical protein